MTRVEFRCQLFVVRPVRTQVEHHLALRDTFCFSRVRACLTGIAREEWWTKDTLGPDADPNQWMITDDGKLRFFRRWGETGLQAGLACLW